MKTTKDFPVGTRVKGNTGSYNFIGTVTNLSFKTEVVFVTTDPKEGEFGILIDVMPLSLEILDDQTPFRETEEGKKFYGDSGLLTKNLTPLDSTWGPKP